MAGSHQIIVDQGSTFRQVSYWREPLIDHVTGDLIFDEDDNVIPATPIDLTGFTAMSHIRYKITDTEPAIELSTENGGIVIPAPTVSMHPWVKAASLAELTLADPQTVDGVALAVGDRVLVKDQADASDDGIYEVAEGPWSRTSDAGVASALTTGAAVWVYQGTAQGDSVWRQANALSAFTQDQSWGQTEQVGRWELVMTDEQTSTLTSSGVYDVELTSAGGETTRVLQGKVRISKEVTRV